jgi:hypothetical protein
MERNNISSLGIQTGRFRWPVEFQTAGWNLETNRDWLGQVRNLPDGISDRLHQVELLFDVGPANHRTRVRL